MGLLEEIEAARHVKRCRVAEVMDDLPPEDAAVLAAVSVNPSVTMRQIIKALKSRNIDLGEKTLGKHRRGDCEC